MFLLQRQRLFPTQQPLSGCLVFALFIIYICINKSLKNMQASTRKIIPVFKEAINMF